jgi:hypothetical protein
VGDLTTKNYEDENNSDPCPPSKAVTVNTNSTISTISSVLSDILLEANKRVLKVLISANGGSHSLVRYDITMSPSGKRWTL